MRGLQNRIRVLVHRWWATRAITTGRLRVLHRSREVAAHAGRAGRRRPVPDPPHFEGVADVGALATRPGLDAMSVAPALLRPLAEEAVVGGDWS